MNGIIRQGFTPLLAAGVVIIIFGITAACLPAHNVVLLSFAIGLLTAFLAYATSRLPETEKPFKIPRGSTCLGFKTARREIRALQVSKG